MKTQLKSIISGLFIALSCYGCEPQTTLRPVGSVDLKRYAGTWYELASYPQFFGIQHHNHLKQAPRLGLLYHLNKGVFQPRFLHQLYQVSLKNPYSQYTACHLFLLLRVP